jgi:hypothetical protein
MTPKQKADQLIDKYWYITGMIMAKDFAIICVDEIINNFEGLNKPEYCAFDAIGERKFTFKGEYDTHMTGYDMIEYWNEVKREIEAL